MNLKAISVRQNDTRPLTGKTPTTAIPRLWMIMLFASVLLLNACAVGNKYDYRIPSMPLPVKGSGGVGLVVSDERPYILSGDKAPNFVGLQRGGFGNPFDVTTLSGRPMAQDMTETLTDALKNGGFRVVQVESKATNLAEIGRAAAAQGLSRVVVLRITEWKTDVAMRVTLHYDLNLLIIDKAGEVIAQNRINGVSAVGGAGMPSAMSGTARQAFESKMVDLFSPSEVRAALEGEVPKR